MPNKTVWLSKEHADIWERAKYVASVRGESLSRIILIALEKYTADNAQLVKDINKLLRRGLGVVGCTCAGLSHGDPNCVIHPAKCMCEGEAYSDPDCALHSQKCTCPEYPGKTNMNCAKHGLL